MGIPQPKKAGSNCAILFHMKRFAKVSSFVSSFLFLFFGTVARVFAACPDGQTDIDIMCVPNTTAGFVAAMYSVGLGLIGGVSLLYIILGGYFILTSQGDAQKLAVGRSYITYAVIGLLLAIFGFVFTTVIAVDILRIPGFN